MGWLYCAKTRYELVQELLKEGGNETEYLESLEHELNAVGDTLWVLHRVVHKEQNHEPQTYIGCYFLDFCPNSNQWGYKIVDEAFHPYRYDCPLSFLGKATHFTNKEWREKVKQWHRTHKISHSTNVTVPPRLNQSLFGERVIVRRSW